MTEGKKQKVLLSVLATLVLGMGSVYWFAWRDSGPGGYDFSTRSDGGKVKRERTTSGNEKTRRPDRDTRSSMAKADKSKRERTKRNLHEKTHRNNKRERITTKKKPRPPAS